MPGLTPSQNGSSSNTPDVCIIQGMDGGIVVGVPTPGDTLCPLKVIFEADRFRGVISEETGETELFSLDTGADRPLKDALARCLNKAKNTRRMPAVSVWRMLADDMRAFGNVSFDTHGYATGVV